MPSPIMPASAKSSLVLSAVAACALAAPLSAQPGKPAPTFKLETSHAGKTDLEARGTAVGEVAVSRLTASLDLPLPPLSESTFLATDIGYSAFFLDRSGPVALPEQLESVEAGLTARHRFDDRWSLITRLSAGVAGSSGTFSSDGLNAGLFALATYQFSETFSAGFGFVYNTLAEELPLIPVAGVRWDFAPDWRFTLAFPSTRVSWTANERLTLRVSLDLDTGSFHVKDDPRPATIGVNGRPSLRDSVLDYTAVSAGLGASYLLTDSLTLDATLGYNFSRTADFDDRNYKIKADEGAPIVRLGLTYAF
jgi:long-subunit fatty acid transport protein